MLVDGPEPRPVPARDAGAATPGREVFVNEADGMLVFAHRGARGHEPENTLRAFARALAMGARWLELDVFPVQDRLVVFHDLRLEGLTDGQGFVWQQTLDHLRSLDAGQGERVPLLDEVFDLAGPAVGINVELKWAGTAALTAAFLDDRLARGLVAPEKCLVSSFLHDELRRFRRLLPQVRIGALTGDRPLGLARFAEELGAYAVHPALSAVDDALVRDAHHRGLKVFVHTVNHGDELSWVRALGVDGVFTDFPDRFGPGAAELP
jgi:glycerophosphoryl diester phosphodiesterase